MKNKKFDCVRMKRDIQEQMAREFSGVSDEQAHKVQMTRVLQSPTLGVFYKKVCSLKRPLRKSGTT